MIIQIDDMYFNPLQITTLYPVGNNVHVWFSDSTPDGNFLVFKNWKIYDLGAEINRCIETFRKD